MNRRESIRFRCIVVINIMMFTDNHRLFNQKKNHCLSHIRRLQPFWLPKFPKAKPQVFNRLITEECTRIHKVEVYIM